MGATTMKLVEKRIYFLKVGLFCHKFEDNSGLFGCGRMAVKNCPVMFDQEFNGWYIFHVLDELFKDMYVKVPIDYLDEEISESFDMLDDNDKKYYEYVKTYNSSIEE